MDGVLAEHRFVLDVVVLDHAHDGDVLGPMQIGHRFGERARGFAAAVPGDDDVIEPTRIGIGLRDEEQMVPRTEQHAFDDARGFLATAIGPDRDERIGGARLARCDIGDDVAKDVEAAELEALADLRQAIVQPRFGRIAGFARLRDELDGVADGDPFVGHDMGEHVDEQRDELAIEGFGQILRGGEPHIIGGAPVQTNHHILDHHRYLPA